MEEFLRFVLGRLVEFPDEVVISRAEQPGKTIFHVVVRKSDIPRIIGRGGHTIQGTHSRPTFGSCDRGTMD